MRNEHEDLWIIGNWGMNMRICAQINNDEFNGAEIVRAIKRKMVWLVKNGEADPENRKRAFQLIRAWGQSQDLSYLPVFHQTYMGLEGENGLNTRGEENSMPGQTSLESLMQRPVPVPPPGSYPVQDRGDDEGLDYNFGNLSIEDKKEQIEITRNSFELLSSMLNIEGKPNHTEEEGRADVLSMLEEVGRKILSIRE
ncbi:PREDICTED: uncharacterized protein LOC104704659 [Camelina sativa]|uniref:Uncharacterized protein LOC104704659 n=1 Tax=Camelina sativa TaxID=90675 RepID=A0ABM0T0N3_CAMSA|nr:PREDICTED: uncharacterized protein LOC104704659 [Camelina sativa]